MTETAFRERVEKIFKNLKLEKKTTAPAILYDVLPNGEKLMVFVITGDMLEKDKTIRLLAKWRDKSNIWFPAQFRVTFEGTKKWAKEQLLDKKDRILFFLKIDSQKEPFGHIGLYRFDFFEKSCEIDNVIRGKDNKQTKGGMSISLQLLIDWTFKYLLIKRLYLRVFSDNERAVSFYNRLGFLELDRTPLVEKRENNITSWVDAVEGAKRDIKRYFIRMYLVR